MTKDDTENKRKRLIFRSWHRGTREMDLLMGTFADKHVRDLSPDELCQYEDILQHNDPDLYNWITGKEQLPANMLNPLWEKLLQHKFAE